MQSYIHKKEAIRAEIKWTLATVSAHIQNHLLDMFPDSIIAKKFDVGQDKRGYMTTFGIAEHFKEKLSDKIQHSNFVSISYDESLTL